MGKDEQVILEGQKDEEALIHGLCALVREKADLILRLHHDGKWLPELYAKGAPQYVHTMRLIKEQEGAIQALAEKLRLLARGDRRKLKRIEASIK